MKIKHIYILILLFVFLVPLCTRHRYIGGQSGLPGSFPHKKGLLVSAIDNGDPTGHNSSNERARLPKLIIKT